RRFLPKEEGGVDKGVAFQARQLVGFTTPDDPSGGSLPRARFFQFQMVPWVFFPARFRDPREYRYDIGLGPRLRVGVMRPFVAPVSAREPPRDQRLRGQYSRAQRELSGEQATGEQARQRFQNARNLDRAVDEGVERTRPVFVQALRASGGPGEAGA